MTSTNDRVRVYPLGTVLLADAQSTGRGRHGNRWISPAGGLYCSYKSTAPNKFHQNFLPIAVGISCHRALRGYQPPTLHLKWPNDLLNARGEKIGGILVERTLQREGPDELIIGIGINLGETVKLPPSSENSSSVGYVAVDRMQLAQEILRQWEQCCREDNESVDELIAYWERFSAYPPGTPVQTRECRTNNLMIGHIAGLSAEGTLQFIREDGKHLFLEPAQVQQLRPLKGAAATPLSELK